LRLALKRNLTIAGVAQDLSDHPMLEYYIRFNGALNADTSFVSISGSAHSKFESSLPSGENHRVRYLRPLSEEEFSKYFQQKFQHLKILKNVDKDKIYDVTGGVFRIL